ncbi:hypothetical protein SOP85_10250 [Pseudomonas sp. YuFO20]|nr:hypothetical protein [Pseudomonas sp. YuFO20]MEB2515818.1 hypothetical protein [Pseudomonas sp. YuFO20]
MFQFVYRRHTGRWSAGHLTFPAVTGSVAAIPVAMAFSVSSLSKAVSFD